jgi:hypothetical protein
MKRLPKQPIVPLFAPAAKSRIARNPEMALVAGVGFEPTTFGL